MLAEGKCNQGVRSSKKKPNSARSFSPIALEILKILGAGNIARDVVKTKVCSKSTVSYWKNRFLILGALRSEHVGVYKTYSLTPYGSKILTGSEELRESCKLEDHAIKFLVIESERVPIDWVKLGEPRNWVKLGVKIGNVRVVKTNRNIIIHPGQLWGFDVDELLVQSGRIVERVKQILENRFGMMLSSEGKPLHDPITHFYSKEAKELVEKYGTTIVDGLGSIDKSPPDRIPHEEYRKRNVATERLLMPLRLTQILEKQENLTAQQDLLEKHFFTQTKIITELTKQMDLHMDVLRKIGDATDDLSKTLKTEIKALVDVFTQESEARSQENLERTARLEKLLASLVDVLKKKKRKRRKSKPKPKTHMQKLMKLLHVGRK